MERGDLTWRSQSPHGFAILGRRISSFAARERFGWHADNLSVKSRVLLDERSADVRLVTDAVAMDDGIDQRKRAQEKDQQNARVATRTIHRGSRGR
jgi:hypothetical protein